MFQDKCPSSYAIFWPDSAVKLSVAELRENTYYGMKTFKMPNLFITCYYFLQIITFYSSVTVGSSSASSWHDMEYLFSESNNNEAISGSKLAATPCNWTGVTCDGLQVSKIHLSCPSAPLNIHFPDAIGNFTNLTYLNLSDCGFIGQFPQTIWNLGMLEYLDVSNNSFSGTLPLLSQMKMLRVLVLDHNNFSGSIPSTIGLLGKLIELSLHENSFSGILPREIGDLHNLVSLDLSTNFFNGKLPSSFGNLTNLLYLDASRNWFRGTIFAEIWSLRMQNLELSWNSLSGSISEDVGNMTSLNLLSVGHNNFEGAVIPIAIGKLQSLKVLNIQSSGFNGMIPYEICNISGLTYLNIAHNNFKGELPEEICLLQDLNYLLASNSGLGGRIPKQLGSCTKLRILDLSFNSFSGYIPSTLAGLESLESAVFDSNKLSGFIPDWISNWTRLESVNFGRNLFNGFLPPLNMPYLTLFDAGSNMLSGHLPSQMCNVSKSLAVLWLAENNFTGEIGDAFRGCGSLTDITLLGNIVGGDIPGYLGEELNLVTLELSKNTFSGHIPDLLFHSNTLLELSLSSNRLKGSLPPSLSNLISLQRLQLDNNEFEGEIPDSIGDLKNLTNLSLHGNRFTGTLPPALFNCNKLVSLDLGFNLFNGSILPGSISHLKLLDNLVLSNNQFSGPIPEDICSAFQNLTLPDSEFTQHYGMLDLSYNLFSGHIPATIGDCVILSQLLLQENLLNGEIPTEISALTALTLLDLSRNEFTGPPVPPSLRLANLQGLLLSHNSFTGPIPEEVDSVFPNLVKLDLSENQIRGPFPASLFSIRTLSYVDISRNLISGPISFRGGLTHGPVIFLNMSNNILSGPLPPSLSSLDTISVLDMHNNRLNGDVPSSLSTLLWLTHLDLSQNKFQNTMPQNICCITGLVFLNLSGNDFSGQIPETCSHTVDCSSTRLPHSSPPIRRASPGFTALLITSSFFLLLLLAFLFRWKMNRYQSGFSEKPGMETEPRSSDQLLTTSKSREPVSINIATFEHSLQRLNPADIVSATENFSRAYIIGDGGFGTVYRASLSGNRTIAVKRLNGGRGHGGREFLAELQTVGKVKHQNLVPLLGYCAFADEKFLIYKFMENGSLDVWLRRSLSWPIRYNICLGAARGIAFLHHGFVPHIIHRDIKSSNILLGRDFEPRVSDFGLARIISACETHVSTILAGSFGYIPPEYGQVMTATAKGDVYSFGVVMLELVTGKEPIGQADTEGGNLVGWVRWMVHNGRELDTLDACHFGSFLLREQMLRVLHVAVMCTSDQPWNRPTMVEVVKLLMER